MGGGGGGESLTLLPLTHTSLFRPGPGLDLLQATQLFTELEDTREYATVTCWLLIHSTNRKQSCLLPWRKKKKKEEDANTQKMAFFNTSRHAISANNRKRIIRHFAFFTYSCLPLSALFGTKGRFPQTVAYVYVVLLTHSLPLCENDQ